MPTTPVPDYDRLLNYTAWVAAWIQPRRVTYAYRFHGDRLHYDVVLLGAGDEPVRVESIMRDGRHIRWGGYQQGDAQIFYPPDGSDINDGFFISCDKRMLIIEPMDRDEIERYALGYRTSIIVTGAVG